MSITLIVALISGFCLSASLLVAVGLGAAAARGDRQLTDPARRAPVELQPPSSAPHRRATETETERVPIAGAPAPAVAQLRAAAVCRLPQRRPLRRR
jgi:hypothetical protein